MGSRLPGIEAQLPTGYNVVNMVDPQVVELCECATAAFLYAAFATHELWGV